VNDKDLHINSELKNTYPRPDVPANEAWASMLTLLDDNSSTGYPPPPPKAYTGLWKYGILLLFTAGILIRIISSKQQSEKNPASVHTAPKNKKPVNPRSNTPYDHNKNSSLSHGQDTQYIQPGQDSQGLVSAGQTQNSSNDQSRNTQPRVNRKNHTYSETISLTYRSEPIHWKTGHASLLKTGHASLQQSKIKSSIVILAGSAGEVDSLHRITVNNISKSIKPSHKDSASVKNTASRKNKLTGFGYGLQWNVPLPLQGVSGYFTGTDGNSKPYNLLIPELYLSKTLGKNKHHQIQLQINPNRQFFTGKKVLSSQTGPLSTQDSTLVTRNTRLLKTSGLGVTIQYNYNFNEKWSVGAGLNFSSYGKALLSMQTARTTDNKLLSDSLYGITRSAADWQYIKSSIFAGKLELSYKIKKFRAGVDIYVPFTNISANPANNIRPINGQLFLRWEIK